MNVLIKPTRKLHSSGYRFFEAYNDNGKKIEGSFDTVQIQDKNGVGFGLIDITREGKIRISLGKIAVSPSRAGTLEVKTFEVAE